MYDDFVLFRYKKWPKATCYVEINGIRRQNIVNFDIFYRGRGIISGNLGSNEHSYSKNLLLLQTLCIECSCEAKVMYKYHYVWLYSALLNENFQNSEKSENPHFSRIS